MICLKQTFRILSMMETQIDRLPGRPLEIHNVQPAVLQRRDNCPVKPLATVQGIPLTEKYCISQPYPRY